MIGRVLVLGLSAAMVFGGAARADEVQVKLVNQGPDGFMAFDPPFTKIKVGDSVKFVAADKGHNAETIKQILPEGAQPFKGELSKDVTVKFDKEGVYGVKCSPHYSMGMTALIAVGDNYPNLAAAKAANVAPLAKKRLEADFAKLGK